MGYTGKKTDVLKTINRCIDHLNKAPLKVPQKLTVIRKYLIPRLLHVAVLGDENFGDLRADDREIRRAVRNYVKLPKDTPLSEFYARDKDGGLGITSLHRSVPFIRRKR